MKFRDLGIGQGFDWVDDDNPANSFYLRCFKISPRRYRDAKGIVHTVGTINAQVFHVGQVPTCGFAPRTIRNLCLEQTAANGDSIRMGDRVQLHPDTDLWMTGARYGSVVSLSGRGKVGVQVDATGRTVVLDPRNIAGLADESEESPQ